MNFVQDIISKIQSKLEPGYELTRGAAMVVDKRLISTDAALYKGNTRLALFEFVGLMDAQYITDAQYQTLDIALKLNVPYAIVCNASKAYVMDTYGTADKGYIGDYMSLNDAIKMLLDTDEEEKPINEYYAGKLEEAIKNAIKESAIEDREVKGGLLNFNKDYILQNAFQSTLFHSITLTKEFEDQIFAYLLKIDNSIGRVCRYTSFNSTIRMIREKKISLCSIVCMNDKSECYYVDQYLFNRQPQPLSELPYDTVKQLNTNFILSCSEIKMRDDLTMWRMYGCEATGVCMVLSVDKSIFKNDFILAPVSYARSNGKHPELDFINNLLHAELKHFRVSLRTLDVWKHFFKPAEYASENEIRLLNVNKKLSSYKWVQTGDPILTPVVEFDIDNGKQCLFPLLLEELMLGPKCKEKETNNPQLRYYIESQGLKVSPAFKVTISSIDNYR